MDHLLGERLNGDCANLVAQHKAALVIQSFVRRSQYCVVTEYHDTIQFDRLDWPSVAFRVKHGVHPQHGNAHFTTHQLNPIYAQRRLTHRYKPLGLALKRR
jgi:hypothetical protein